MRWLDRRLSIRQTAYTLSVVVVLTTAIGSVEVILAYRSERQRLVSTMNQWFESVADTSARAAYHVDKRQAEAVLDGLMKFKTVAFARITTDLNAVLAQRARGVDSVDTAPMNAIAEWLFGDIASQQRALTFDRSSLTPASEEAGAGNFSDMLVGVIELKASPALVASDFLNRIGGLMIALVLEFFLLAAALAFIFHRTLTRSLVHYADDLGHIEAHGTTLNPVAVPPGHERDELGLVVSRTNDLLARIFDLREAEALAQHDLEDSERRFRSTFENAAVGIVDLDGHQHIVRSNGHMAEMLGYASGSLVGLNLDGLVHAGDIDADREWRMSLAAGEIPTYTVEKRFIRNDGSVMYGNVTVSRVKERDALPYELIAIIQDITHSKQQEAKIEAQRVALIHRERIGALGSLLAGVAHELNNPLAVVMAQAELLAETAADEKTKTRADKILRPAERCARIVRTFLALARQREVKKTHVDVKGLIDDVRELLDYQFRTNDIEITVDIAPDLPAIWGDSAQLSQLLMNLLVNAQQALMVVSAHRVVAIRTARVDEHNLAISVSDNGSGIPGSIQDRIFEPFFTTKPEGQGTGLGLSYCLSVAESHGGTVALEKTGTVGTTMILTLPIGVADPEAVATGPEPAVSRSGCSLRVLIVDDETELLDTMVEAMANFGFSAVGCQNASAAIDALAAESFDLIVTDIRMPGVDGPAFYENVCAIKPGLRDRVIFMTGDRLNERARHFIETTKAPCLYKPFEMKALERALYDVIKRTDHDASESDIADDRRLETKVSRGRLL